MTDLKINLHSMLNHLKIRYLTLTIVFMISIFVIPVLIPFGANYSPVYSVNSELKVGHSLLKDHLNTRYDIDTFNLGISSYNQKIDAYILINPQLELSFNDYMEYFGEIFDLTYQGIPIIIVGANKNLQYIENYFPVQYISPDFTSQKQNAVYDKVNNAGEPGLPTVWYGNSLTKYTSVVPWAIKENSFSLTDKILKTSENASIGQCYLECYSSYPVGLVSPRNDFAFIADSWMFSNQYVNSFPQNLELFDKILSDLGVQNGKLVFDESLYEWAPFNPDGVNHFFKYRFNFVISYLFLVIIGVIVPILIGFSANVYGKDGKTKETQLDLNARLSYIHLEKLPAAPLTTEEKLLVDEKLELISRNKYYFQYVAYRILRFIDEQKLGDAVPPIIFTKLHAMKSQLLPDDLCWDIVKEANKTLSDIVSEPTLIYKRSDIDEN